MSRKPPTGTQLNLSHPMAKDLIFFCAMDRTGNQIDLVNGTVGVSVFPANVRTIVTPYGLVQDLEYLNFDTSVGFDFGNTGGSGVYEPTELTIITRARFETEVDSPSESRIVAKKANVAATDDWGISIASAGDGFHFNVNDSDDVITRTSGNYQGVLTDLALAVDTIGQDNYVWEPETGSFQTSLGQTGATVATSSQNLAVGHQYIRVRTWDGEIHYVAIWKRKKTQAFINAFRLNPWQIFQPQSIPTLKDIIGPSIAIVEKPW